MAATAKNTGKRRSSRLPSSACSHEWSFTVTNGIQSCVFCPASRTYRGSRKGNMRVFVREDAEGNFLGFDEDENSAGTAPESAASNPVESYE